MNAWPARSVVLRQTTSQHLSPAVWITGSAEPATWRSANTLIRQLWLGVSVAMLLGLIASGDTGFFYKAVDAQIDFITDGGTLATSLVLHQGGGDFTMPRIDAATVDQLKADLASRVASNTPAPGSEAAARKFVAAVAAGTPNYEDMSPGLAKAVREQSHQMKGMMDSLGAVQSIEFVRVGEGGWDTYRVKFANGALSWRVGLAPDGKIDYSLVLPDA